jgi:hypothetical protein
VIEGSRLHAGSIISLAMVWACSASSSADPERVEARQSEDLELPVEFVGSECKVSVTAIEVPEARQSASEVLSSLAEITGEGEGEGDEDPLRLADCTPGPCMAIRGAVLDAGSLPGDFSIAVAVVPSPAGEYARLRDIHKAMSVLGCKATIEVQHREASSWSSVSFAVVHPQVVGSRWDANETPCDPLVDEDCMIGCFDGERVYVDLLLFRSSGRVLQIQRECP